MVEVITYSEASHAKPSCHSGEDALKATEVGWNPSTGCKASSGSSSEAEKPSLWSNPLGWLVYI